MEILTPAHWTEYEMIDTGNREKLERFGKYILIRPEPQAVWQKSLSESEWEKMAHARYERQKGPKQTGAEYDRGSWIKKPKMVDQWNIQYRYRDMNLTFRLGLTSFGHIGIFPEQSLNWNYIYDLLNPSRVTHHASRVSGHPSRILNLFAYTGGTSLAAKAAGADVTHVDAVKPVITWAREMMEASGLTNIRWVVEDAMAFVRREVKRGNRYNGIILDPPAYGRGPDGEKWILEDSVDEIIALCQNLLDPDQGFFILNLYSMGFSSLIAENLVRTHFIKPLNVQSGEFYLTDKAQRKLPLGVFSRFSGNF